MFIHNNAYYNKRGSGGVCIALAATIVYVGYYCLGSVTMVWFGSLGFNASATARVISRRWNDDEISFLVEETGVPGGNHRPMASNWWNFSHIRPLPSPGIELGPQRCEAKWAKAWWERRLGHACWIWIWIWPRGRLTYRTPWLDHAPGQAWPDWYRLLQAGLDRLELVPVN